MYNDKVFHDLTLRLLPNPSADTTVESYVASYVDLRKAIEDAWRKQDSEKQNARILNKDEFPL